MPEETAQYPALGISVKTQASEGREIVFQTHIAQDASIVDLNALLDKMTAAADRQSAKAALITLYRDLEDHEKQLRQLEEDYSNIEANAAALWAKNGRKGDYKPNQRDAAQKQQVEANVKRWREVIGKLKLRIAEFEAKAK